MNIKENLEIIQEKITQSEIKAGRPEKSVKLLAVSKFHSAEEIEQSIQAGQFMFGENRVQEAVQKFPELMEAYPHIKLHMIGSLQLNKVKNIVKISDCIQSVDRLELLEEIEKQCCKTDKKINILFEIHTGEESKSGFKTIDLLQEALENFSNQKYPHINPKGFMTMAPFTSDEAAIHKSFSSLRLLAEDMQKKYKSLTLNELSMGMSGDFEIAIEEGSTMVRIGTAIFGERKYK